METTASLVTNALWLVASIVLPTLVLRVVARPPARPQSHRIAAWCCLWASQLTAPLLLVALVAVDFGRELFEIGHVVGAIIYGGGGAAIVVVLVVAGVGLLRAALSILCFHDDKRAVGHCARAAGRTTQGLLGVAILFGLMIVIPIPGHFGPLLFVFLVLVPASIGGAMMLLVAGGGIRVLRPRR